MSGRAPLRRVARGTERRADGPLTEATPHATRHDVMIAVRPVLPPKEAPARMGASSFAARLAGAQTRR
jgi:hypothetical protein